MAWAAVAYGAGIVAGPVVSPGVAFLGALLLLACARHDPLWALALVLLGGVGYGLGHHVAARDAATCGAQWPPGKRTAEIVLLDGVEQYGAVASALVTGAECRGTIRVRWATSTVVPGGTRVLVEGQWRRTLRVTKARVLEAGASRRGTVRGRIERRYEKLFGSRAPFASAITLARPSSIDSETREQFVRAGLAHLLAISGLHVGFLGWWAAWLLGRLNVPRRRSLLGACGVVTAYIWMLGFPAPATRAACFLAIGVAARYRERVVHPGAVIAVAALTVLTLDPAAARSVGAWLSLAAVAGIAWSRTALSGPSAWRVTCGATLFTAPITAFVFGTVAPIGLLVNLVAVPLAALAVPGILLALAMSWLLPPLADLFAAGAGLAMEVLEIVAERSSRIPYGHVIGVGGFRSMWPWGASALLVVWARWNRPTGMVSLRRLLLPLPIVAWAWTAAGVIPRNTGDDLAIHFIAVGQGDAAAIRTPQGRWLLIDAGPAGRGIDMGRRVVVPYLRRNGARSLVAVFLSHGDADHVGGMAATLDAFPRSHVWEPGQAVGEDAYLRFLDAVERTGAEWYAARRGDTLTVDSVRFIIHHPDNAWLDGSLDRNENSLLIEVRYRGFRALFPGDGGVPMERHHLSAWGPIQVLKVGHHGSATATSAEWLDRVDPEVAVISVGRGNRFGHPRPEVLGRLARREITVYRTDRDGSIVLRTDGRTYTIRVSN